MEKLINKQNLSYIISENNIPISKQLENLIKKKKLKKINLISNGDDYQVLFTANPSKSRIILNISKKHHIKITKIGKIISGRKKPIIIDQKGREIMLKNKGYSHQF